MVVARLKGIERNVCSLRRRVEHHPSELERVCWDMVVDASYGFVLHRWSAVNPDLLQAGNMQ